ncbi:MAG: hypothetical protein KR126chlam1_01365 [Chlamydiae bacterium]|nr:hypothetical protein [Chlamydiota bacterium]
MSVNPIPNNVVDVAVDAATAAPNPAVAIAGTVVAVANTALQAGGHRTTGGFVTQGSHSWHGCCSSTWRATDFLTQGSHRSPGEWLAQGNHWSVFEWFSGVSSRNK